MSELPDNIKAIQAYFRTRFEAQDARMEATAAAAFAARIANSPVTLELSAEEAIAYHTALAKGEANV